MITQEEPADSQRQLRIYRRSVIALSLLSIILVFSFFFREEVFKFINPKESVKSAAVGNTPFDRHVAEAGISTCKKAFADMGKLLTQGSQYKIMSKWSTDGPDRNIVNALIGMEFKTKEYTGPAIGLLMAAPVDSSCQGTMVRVTPFEKTCDDVVKSFLGDGIPGERLQGLQTYSLPNGGDVATLPIAGNCVTLSLAYSGI
ncbi:hypothetical protein [Agrobacterium sp. SORGH_AS 787]|uniref:hypothetical protein n=1 Tax=Agrobacterium sp. SORGH_AS 787 TaxID=3041775 RepID=UPI00278A2EE8|nr:hypothetical protein [Rhizobium sp. SORGH_AS_0787]